jgi:hypothetical protein
VIVDGEVDNDASLDLIARVALSQAEAGADAVWMERAEPGEPARPENAAWRGSAS